MTTTKAKPAAKPKAAAEATNRPPCLCGCLDFPKGANSRFIPGHDARYHAAQKAAEKAAAS